MKKGLLRHKWLIITRMRQLHTIPLSSYLDTVKNEHSFILANIPKYEKNLVR